MEGAGYVITFSDVMAGVITVGLGMLTFLFGNGWMASGKIRKR